MAEVIKRLRMFAGPNGSGKTSVVRKFAREFTQDGLFQLHRFINADEILADLRIGRGVSLSLFGLPDISTADLLRDVLSAGRLTSTALAAAQLNVESHVIHAKGQVDAYAAASIADYLREKLLEQGSSFSFETVMSHRSKVDFLARAQQLGFRTYLYFVATQSPQLNIDRVRVRAATGGHDVATNMIIARYGRSLALLQDALAHSSRAFIFDNSDEAPICLAEQQPNGKLEIKVPEAALPDWFRNAVPQAKPV